MHLLNRGGKKKTNFGIKPCFSFVLKFKKNLYNNLFLFSSFMKITSSLIFEFKTITITNYLQNEITTQH
jgi:hypothetical protein